MKRTSILLITTLNLVSCLARSAMHEELILPETLSEEIILSQYRDAVVSCSIYHATNFVSPFSMMDTLCSIYDTSTTCLATQETDFINTSTQLDELSNDIAICCASLIQDFASTWTQLTQLNTCCSTLNTGIIPLAASTITAPGSYILTTSLTAPITIASDDVTLDLNDYPVIGSTNGVIINSNLSRVTVRNGSVINSSASGLVVNSGCRAIHLQNLLFDNCGNTTNPFAISCLGTSNSFIQDITLDHINTVSCLSGIIFNYVDEGSIEDCSITTCHTTTAAIGIKISGDVNNLATSNSILRTTISDCVSTSSIAVGILVNNTENTLCQDCAITNLFSSNGDTVGVTLNNAQNSSLAKLYVADLISVAANSSTIGIQVNSGSSPSFIQQPVIMTLASASTCHGIQLNAPAIVIQDGVIDKLSSVGTAVGIQANTTASEASIAQTTCVNITGTLTAYGMQLNGSQSHAQANEVSDITAGLTASGYIIGSTTLASVFDNNQSLNITVTGGTSAVAGGFTINGDGIVLVNCINTGIIGIGTNATAQGFVVNSSANNTVLDWCVTSSTFATTSAGFLLAGTSATVSNCLSQMNSGNGFTVTGNNNVVQQCQALNSSTGIANSGSGSAIFSNTASKNSTNYSGISVLNIMLLGAVVSAGGNLSA